MQKIVQIAQGGWETITPGLPGQTKFLNLELSPRALWADPVQGGGTFLITWTVPTARAVSGSSIRPLFQVLAAAPLRVPASDLRSRFAELIDWATETKRPIVITNHGKPEAVLVSFPVFDHVIKGLAKVITGLGRRHYVDRTEEVIESETQALSRRLRQRGSPGA